MNKHYKYNIYVCGTTFDGEVVVDDNASYKDIEQAIIDDAVADISFEEYVDEEDE